MASVKVKFRPSYQDGLPDICKRVEWENIDSCRSCFGKR